MNDSEDADLEFLRQAALKSLLKKKKNISSTTNAVFYNSSAKPNLISIQPVKEECYDEEENNDFSTEYVIAEGLSVSSSDVDEIVEEVIVSGEEGEEEESSEGEDAVSVASKDSFDEILNSIEEEVKTDRNGTTNAIKRRRPADTSSNRSDKDTGKDPRRVPSSSSRMRSRSPPAKKFYQNQRRPNELRKSSPVRYNRRSRSRSPPPLRRRSPASERRDHPRTNSSFSEGRRRTRTRSPAENRRPRTRSPLETNSARSLVDDRRNRGAGSRPSFESRRPRSRSPRKRSRTPLNRRPRSPFVHDGRRRRASPQRRRPIVENSRRHFRRSRSRSPLKVFPLDGTKHSSTSPTGSDAKISSTGQSEGEARDETKLAASDTQDNVDTEPSSSSSRRSQSPENKRVSETLKLNAARSTKSERQPQPYRKRADEHNRQSGHRENRERISRSPERTERSRDRVRRGFNNNRRSRSPVVKNKRRTQSRSPPAKKKRKSRSPSPPRNLSKEELEVFEKRKRKFEASVNVGKLSGKITLKPNKTDLPERDHQAKQNSSSSRSRKDSTTTERVKMSVKKSELSSRLGEIVPEEFQPTNENSNAEIVASSREDLSPGGASSTSMLEDDDKGDDKGLVNSDDATEDLRTKLQQKRAVGMGRLFSAALKDTLLPEDSSKSSSSKRKGSANKFLV